MGTTLTAFKGTAFKIAQTYQNSTEPYKDAQVIHTSRLLPYISPQPGGNSDADTGRRKGTSFAAGISLQGNAGAGTAGSHPMAYCTWSNPE